jgi:aspartate/methionine/tyrosine aminotransferase
VQDAETSTSPAVRSAVAQAMTDHLCDHYTRRPGIAPLCRRVAAALADVGMTVDADDGVVIAGGPQETRFVALRTLAAGGAVYVRAGASKRYASAAQLAEATLLEYEAETPIGQSPGVWIWQPGSATLAADLDPDAVIIADLLDGAGSLEPLRELGETSASEQVLILGNFGADAGLDAWNVAWFAGPKPLAAKVRTLKQAMTICTPAPGQYAALAVLEGASL